MNIIKIKNHEYHNNHKHQSSRQMNEIINELNEVLAA